MLFWIFLISYNKQISIFTLKSEKASLKTIFLLFCIKLSLIVEIGKQTNIPFD